MLTDDQIELIHREIDGENSPVETAAFHALVERDLQARALHRELAALANVFHHVEEREPPQRLRQEILGAMGQRPEAHAPSEREPMWVVVAEATRWVGVQWAKVTTLMEETMLTKKGLVLGTTTIAAVAIVGALVVGYPPSGGEVGTIGGGSGDTISGVQQASRYRGRSMSAADVTLSNPEIQALFQNHEILKLVQSDVFRSAMKNEAFRELQSNEAYRQLMASDAYRQLLASEAYRELMNSEAYRELMASEAYRELLANESFRQLQAQDAFRQMQSSEAMRALQANDAFRALQANESFRELMATDAFRAAMASEAFRAAMANEAFRAAMNSEAFRAAMANEAFRAAMANDAFRQLMANDAFRQLQASESFRALSRSAAASEAFLTEAMRAAQ
jgi:hypothetical protein